MNVDCLPFIIGVCRRRWCCRLYREAVAIVAVQVKYVFFVTEYFTKLVPRIVNSAADVISLAFVGGIEWSRCGFDTIAPVVI